MRTGSFGLNPSLKYCCRAQSNTYRSGADELECGLEEAPGPPVREGPVDKMGITADMCEQCELGQQKPKLCTPRDIGGRGAATKVCIVQKKFSTG